MADDRRQRAEAMRKERESAEKRQRTLITVAIVAVVVALIGGGAYAVSATSKDNEKETEVVAPAGFGDTGFVYPADTEVTDDAPVVETYADFLCPHCADFETVGGAYLKDLADAGEIRLSFTPMVVLDGQDTGGPAHAAMNAAVCAADVDGPDAFWTMHEALFAERFHESGTPTSASLVGVSDDAGVDGLESCIRQGSFVPWLGTVREKAQERGVSGTPTIFVDGEQVEDVSLAGLQAALRDAQAA